MIGDVRSLHGCIYVVVNLGGTLEKLNRIGWLWSIVLFFKCGSLRHKMTIAEVREFCREHRKAYRKAYRGIR